MFPFKPVRPRFLVRGTSMTRLLDGKFSEGFDTIVQLARHGDFTTELAEAIRKKGGVDRTVYALNQEFFPVPRRWFSIGCVTYFKVTLDKSTSGEDWITRTAEHGNVVHAQTHDRLCCKDFKQSAPGKYLVAVFDISLLENDKVSLKEIRVMANKKGFETPNTDIACLVREQFSDQDIYAMGFDTLLFMHDPIVDQNLLYIPRLRGARTLSNCNGWEDVTVGRGHDAGKWGCAFLCPENISLLDLFA